MNTLSIGAIFKTSFGKTIKDQSEFLILLRGNYMSYLKVIRLKEVINRTGLSKSKIYDAINKGEFPAPSKIFENGRAVCWSEKAINDFLSKVLEAA